MLTIVPSILSCDHCNILHGVQIAESYGIERLHVDIMDGEFVDNISFGPQLVKDLRKHTKLELDIHLMLKHPEKFIDRFIASGVNSIAIHQESSGNIASMLSSIRSKGCSNAIAINPDTLPDSNLLPLVDYVLIMGVYPGFGSQKFIPDTIKTIEQLINHRQNSNLSYQIAIDGGITSELAKQLARIGVNIIISGHAFFQSPQRFINEMRSFL